MGSTSVPKSAVDLSADSEAMVAPQAQQSKPPSKTKRPRKKPVSSTPHETAATTPNETDFEPVPKKKQTRKKTKETDSSMTQTPLETNITVAHPVEQKTLDETANQPETPKMPKKSSQRVGKRKPKRDTVGQQ